jgi:hypothetical protein
MLSLSRVQHFALATAVLGRLARPRPSEEHVDNAAVVGCNAIDL